MQIQAWLYDFCLLEAAYDSMLSLRDSTQPKWCLQALWVMSLQGAARR